MSPGSRSAAEKPGGATPKISILTVVRDGAPTLRRAIESVVRQLDPRFEYIVIDGASTDGSREIIKDYESRLAMWVSEPDRGIYDAMNKALAAARGEWAIFLGSDDELLTGLDAAARAMTDRQAVYYGDVEIAGSGRISGGRFNRYKLMQRNICHQAIFYPRAIYRAKPYDTKAGMLADYKYNIELWGQGTRFEYLPRVISRFDNRGRSSGDQSYFEPIKMAAIRDSFGPILHSVKRARTAAAEIVRGRQRFRKTQPEKAQGEPVDRRHPRGDAEIGSARGSARGEAARGLM